MTHAYEALQCSMDLSIAALEEVYTRIGPARTYTIHAGWGVYNIARRIQQDICSKSVDNPFAPVINVIYESELQNCEWYVTALDKAVGSRGFA